MKTTRKGYSRRAAREGLLAKASTVRVTSVADLADLAGLLASSLACLLAYLLPFLRPSSPKHDTYLLYWCRYAS